MSQWKIITKLFSRSSVDVLYLYDWGEWQVQWYVCVGLLQATCQLQPIPSDKGSSIWRDNKHHWVTLTLIKYSLFHFEQKKGKRNLLTDAPIRFPRDAMKTPLTPRISVPTWMTRFPLKINVIDESPKRKKLSP